jgi:transposase
MAHSEDLRWRVVAEVEADSSRRAAARRFRVGDSSAIRWTALKAQTGSVSPRLRGGKSRSPLEPHKDWLLALIAQEPGLTLEETVGRIERELGLATTDSSVSRFFQRHGISFKKNPARGRAGSAGRGRRARGLEDRPGEP